MSTVTSNRRAWRIATTAIGAIAMISGVAGGAQSGWENVVSPELLRIYAQSSAAGAMTGGVAAGSARFDSSGRVQIDVEFDCSTAAPTQQLASAGLQISVTVKRPPLCVVEGWAPPASLPEISALLNVERVKLPAYRLKTPHVGAVKDASRVLRQAAAQASSPPAIDGNAVSIMHADVFASQTGTSGAGVTVGVISDDVTNLAVIQGRGELPAVQVLTVAGESALIDPTDEGTMMLEEVHAVAPGAALAFCGPQTSAEYLSCLGQLATAGATVIVDDLAFGDEDLLSSNSTFVQGVESFLSQNPKEMLFTVTENYNGSYWQGNYAPVPISSLGLGISSATCNGNNQTDFYANNFGSGAPGGGSAETLVVDQDATYLATFQWADPFGQNASNFDVYWLLNSTGELLCVGAAGSANTFFGPAVPLAAGTYSIFIATPDPSLAGKFLKLWFGGDGLTTLSPSSPGSVISPQAFAPGVIMTGAVNAADGVGDTIEPYSGQGPVELVFPSTTTIQAPTLVGPDAVYVDNVGTDFPNSADGLFHGTSAASPNAAAVAALIRSAFPSLTPAQVTSALENGASALGTGQPNNVYGYGRVDAVSALASLQAPSLSGFANTSIVGGTSSSSTALAVSGVGNLVLSVTSSNPSLIPASLVSAGTPGVTITPTTCGTSTGSCMISVTPAAGQVGSATITVTATDGAKRTASVTATITVTMPSASTGGSGGHGGGGGAMDYEVLLLLSGVLVFRRARRLIGAAISG